VQSDGTRALGDSKPIEHLRWESLRFGMGKIVAEAVSL
jgi:hypothetical protein